MKGEIKTVRYKVIENRKAETKNPIKVSSGEVIKTVEESNPEGDWPNWIYCKSAINSGWIPKQIIDDNGRMLEDYDAHEFDIVVGDIIESKKILNGWVWGTKNNNKSLYGWAPLNCLKLMD